MAGSTRRWHAAQTLDVPVQLEQRVWFNSELRSRNFLVPGLIAIIMTLIGALLTALVMAREWERGTMEALMVTPVTMREVLLGKLMPYFILGMGGMALSVAMGVWLFGVPLRGSLWVLFAASSLFLLAALGMGLLISTRDQEPVRRRPGGHHHHLPAGLHPVGVHLRHRQHARRRSRRSRTSSPRAISWPSCRRCFLAGNVWSVILPNALALLLMAAFFLGLSRRKSAETAGIGGACCGES